MSVPVINNALTAIEGAFNLIAYTPKSNIQQQAADSRHAFGVVLTVAGVATSAIAFITALFSKTYMEQAKGVAVDGVKYALHGALNIARSYVEKRNWVVLTFAYDLYNKPLLAYTDVNQAWNIQARVFAFAKDLLDRLDIPGIIPAISNRISAVF